MKPTRLVYIGNLGEGYDLETVIAAVAAEIGLSLEIAGRGPKELKLRGLASALDGRVRFHGYLGEAELKELLAGCDIGVIPMRDDSWVGIPYKLGDYLKAGLRVVSSLHGECGELIEREKIGAVYDFGSVPSLLAALEGVSRLQSDGVKVPPELDAALIYRDYVERITRD